MSVIGQARTYTEEFKAQAIKLAKEVGSKRAAEEQELRMQLRAQEKEIKRFWTKIEGRDVPRPEIFL